MKTRIGEFRGSGRRAHAYGFGICMVGVAILLMAHEVPAQQLSDASSDLWSMRSELIRLSEDPDASCDDILHLSHRVAFTAGLLMRPSELGNALARFEDAEHPIDLLVLALIWRDYHDSRTVRRIEGDDSSDFLRVLAQISSVAPPAVSACALATMAEKATWEHPALRGDVEQNGRVHPGRVAALNDLVIVSPNAQSLEELLLAAFVDHAVWEWPSPDPHESFLTSYSWSIQALDKLNTLEIVYVLRGILSNQFPVASAIKHIMSEEVGTVPNVILKLLQSLDSAGITNESALLSLESALDSGVKAERIYQANPKISLSLLEHATRSGRNDSAIEQFSRIVPYEHLQSTHPKRWPELANALAMALVRANRESEAIRVFSALAILYADTQIAAYAEEHIAHLETVMAAR